MNATGQSLTIPASVRSSDGAKYARFDARDWFVAATPEQILALAGERWDGGSHALEVARCAAPSCDEVADVFQYVMHLRHGGLHADCIVHVDAVSALEWLAYLRPQVLRAVRQLKHVA